MRRPRREDHARYGHPVCAGEVGVHHPGEVLFLHQREQLVVGDPGDPVEGLSVARCDVTRRRVRGRGLRRGRAGARARSRCWSPTPGITQDQLLALMSEEDFTAVLDTNLTGAYRVAKRAVARHDADAPRPDDLHLLGRRAARLGRPGQLRRLQGRPGRPRPVAGPRARLAQHHRQRGRARLRGDRHDRGAARGAQGGRSSASVPLGRYAPRRRGRRRGARSWPATTRPTSPARSSRSTAASAWDTDGHPTGSGTMGILDGKRILVTGVLTDASIAFHVARVAQEQGARSCSPAFGRAEPGRADRQAAARARRR